ncbi:MAG: DUF499 domain-containing protein, partial [Candidatus Methylomirabilales bacterium]
GPLRQQIAEWTRQRGKSPRLYPGSPVWCLKKPGRDLREKVELWLAWKRVVREIAEGTLGTDFDRADRADIQAKVSDAEEAAKDEVWGGYRFVVLADSLRTAGDERQPGQEGDGLKTIDLGAGHASGAETLCGRVITALKSQALLNESVGAGYIDRNWPPALKESGAWPLSSLRQSFLNGALTRLLDPDAVLRGKIVEFVGRGDFGLGSGAKPDGTYARVWHAEPLPPEEVAFEAAVFLLTKAKARVLKGETRPEPEAQPVPPAGLQPQPGPEVEPGSGPSPVSQTRTVRLVGTVPPEVWNRLGTRLLPKLRSGAELKVGVEFSVTLEARMVASLVTELRQALQDLGLEDRIRIE